MMSHHETAITRAIPDASEVRTTIRICVSYPWTKRDGVTVRPRSDPRWQSIKEQIAHAIGRVKTTISRRSQATFPFRVSVGRLRGSHGQMLLDNLRARIMSTDVLIADIGETDATSFNSNVLLETGMALGLMNDRLNGVFILKPTSLITPSDLRGYLFTDYDFKSETGEIKIHDAAGFQAALGSVLMNIAHDRQMVGVKADDAIDYDDDLNEEGFTSTE